MWKSTLCEVFIVIFLQNSRSYTALKTKNKYVLQNNSMDMESFTTRYSVSKLQLKPKHCFLVLLGHWCLRNVNLRAPEAVRSGESLTLSCTYVLEREKLYSVKFYLGDIEFYRFVPRESPPTRVFRPNGVSIKVRAPFGC